MSARTRRTGRAWRGPVARVVRIFVALLLVAVAPVARAHVGSPDTWFEGQAGPYPVRVVVRAPGVVPGLSDISVRVLAGHPARVTAQPFAWNAGPNGAPPPDVAKPVPGDPQLWSLQLWFMVATSYGVHLTVSGAEGSGMVIVPVQAVPTRRLPLEGPLALTLVALGLFLFVGFVTLVGAATREASLPPGELPRARERLRARVSIVIAAVVMAAALAGGRRWWNGVDRAYTTQMYRPLHVSTRVESRPEGRLLRLAIDDERLRERRWSPLIPDHGKLMHLFLVRDSDMAVMAHLHPVMHDSSHFEVALPPVPAGLYRVYADVVHESGFATTFLDSVRVPEALQVAGLVRPEPRAAGGASATAGRGLGAEADWTATDADDSWYQGDVAADAAGDVRCALPDGGTLVWERGGAPLVVSAEAPLRFRVLAPDGSPARLEPFLGMAGHAMLRSRDGAVFAHLHPIGSVAMASQMALEMRTPADSVLGTLGRRMTAMNASMPGMTHTTSSGGTPAVLPGEFAIPYGFPRAGRYRMWVQIRRAGRIETGAFDLEVAAQGGRPTNPTRGSGV